MGILSHDIANSESLLIAAQKKLKNDLVSFQRKNYLLF